LVTRINQYPESKKLYEADSIIEANKILKHVANLKDVLVSSGMVRSSDNISVEEMFSRVTRVLQGERR